MASRTLRLALLGAAIACAPLSPQAIAQGDDDRTSIPFRRAEVRGNRLILRGGDVPPAPEAPADGRQREGAPADAVAGTAEAESNPGAEREKNAGAEAEKNAGAEAEKNAGAETEAAARAEAEARAEEEAERAAEMRRLARVPDLGAEEEAEVPEPIEAAPAPAAGYGATPAGGDLGAADVEEAADAAAGYGREAAAGLTESEMEAAGLDDAAEDLDLIVDAEAPGAPTPLAAAEEDEAVDLSAAAEAAGELDADAAAEAAEAAAAAGEIPAGGAPAPGEEARVGETSEAGEPGTATEAQATDEAAQRQATIDVINQLNLNQQLLNERTMDLEAGQEALRDRGTGLEEARLLRIEAYDAAIAAVGDLEAFLATGGGTGAAAQLASLSLTLEQLAENSLAASGEEEANHALRARDAVNLARAQLQEGDLFQARLRLVDAREALARARAVAQTTAEPLFREE